MGLFVILCFLENNTMGVEATGGTITTDGSYRIHTFTSSGTFEVSEGVACDVLIVAGGGGGGGSRGGGGGGGGLIYTNCPATIILPRDDN